MSEIFTPGQRWISNAEPELGLGIIIESANRRVLIAFPASEEERTYAADTAPLSRIQFQEGDKISLPELEPMTVRAVEEQGGCLVYMAEDRDGGIHPVPEQILSAHIQLNSAKDRLLAGQVDHHRRYELRVATLEQGNAAAASRCRGLLGPRVQLLPHQFYIAHQAAQREHVRLLLADEVGLGKTIEAGLILHQRLLEERVKRVLILVPETLVNQWLVEMLRRFNLSFSVFNEARCQEIDGYRDDADSVFYDEEEELSKERNPFETAQLVIASIDWLANAPRRGEQLCKGDWDMLIVDEAHNQHWREEGEADPDYQLLERLCQSTPSVLMLTATPENAGIEGHFARLRLLDPHRYPSLDAFRAEQAGYADISALIERLQTAPADLAADTGAKKLLGSYLGDEQAQHFYQSPDTGAADAINALLDRFGTGRSLFRNSRASIGGFPSRRLHEYPLDGELAGSGDGQLKSRLFPELDAGEDWVSQDPRLRWLEKFLLGAADDKVLLICAHAETARDIELFLRLRRGIASAVFDESMSLLERDRAAAYFADPDDGAQLLVCSEIGSEGRNFQFAEHLVLFDLPLNPDLLEQRIGRLDRIGRSGEIHIHVPFIEGSPQHKFLCWYRDALSIFTMPCTIGGALMAQFEDHLLAALLDTTTDITAIEPMIADAVIQAQALREELSAGRNRLLELNSCRHDEASAFVEQLKQEQRSDALASYIEQLADQYGLEHEDHSEGAIILRPGDHMLTEAFPHLPEEGFTGTFDRQRALSREDMAYLSWEHPLVHDAMNMIMSSDFGSATVCTLPVKGLPPGTLLLEAIFNPSVQAPAALQLSRFLPGTSLRLLIDSKGKNLDKAVSHDKLNQLCQNVKRKLIPALMRQLRDDLGAIVQKLDDHAEPATAKWREDATAQYHQERQQERHRLVSLAERNPEIGESELAAFDADTATGEKALEGLQLNLYALRLAITNPA